MKTKYLPIIRDFREKINNDKNFVILHYLKNNDVNHWNLICSAMDWMSVAAGYLDNPQSSEDLDVESMLVYTYISSIDIIWEAIIKLHQAIFKTKSYPFNNCRQIFENTNKTDNRHFKHIRAAFGAHPVDLHGTGCKQFASWPTNQVDTEYSWSVRLYSSDKTKDDITFGFRYKEVDQFIDERIQYLGVLLKKVETEKEEFSNFIKTIPIKLEGNLLEKAKLLKSEVEKRFNKGNYFYVLDNIIRILDINITNTKNESKINIYIEQLSSLVEEMHKKTQAMTEITLDTEKILHPTIPKDIAFAYSCLSENVFGSSHKPFSRKAICDYLESYVEVDDKMKPSELYLLMNVTLYLNNK